MAQDARESRGDEAPEAMWALRRGRLAMITTGDLKKGLTLELDGQPYVIVEWQHIKMGRGGAIVRIKLRNLRTGSLTERTFDAGEKFQRIYLDRHKVQYSYNEGDVYHFLDQESYEMVPLTAEQLGDVRYYLLDGMELEVAYYNDEPISVDPPITVEMTVEYTEPGFKGDTATGGTKPATTQTGLVVQVPLFVSTGDRIRVKTDTGTYVERVS